MEVKNVQTAVIIVTDFFRFAIDVKVLVPGIHECTKIFLAFAVKQLWHLKVAIIATFKIDLLPQYCTYRAVLLSIGSWYQGPKIYLLFF